MWPVFRLFSDKLSGFSLSKVVAGKATSVQWSQKQPRHLDNLILENNLFSDFQGRAGGNREDVSQCLASRRDKGREIVLH